MSDFEETVIKHLVSLNNNLAEFKEQTNQRFENLEKELTNQISKLRRSVILLENKVSTEIPALFDGYKANRELLEDIKVI